MMPELSLNILDVAQNSVSAGAGLTSISIRADTAADRLTIAISDDGRGMPPEQAARVTDPFFTTRTTRRVGLGIPFFKMAAELTGGSFDIRSEPGVGTTTRAVFGLSHIDRMPLGDIAQTFVSLVGANPHLDFVLSYRVDDCSFVADTREFRAVLEDISLDAPEVLDFIVGYIGENRARCDAALAI
jgi:signal transduction histidine kinase